MRASLRRRGPGQTESPLCQARTMRSCLSQAGPSPGRTQKGLRLIRDLAVLAAVLLTGCAAAGEGRSALRIIEPIADAASLRRRRAGMCRIGPAAAPGADSVPG